MGRHTWRLRQSLRAVRSSRASGLGRDKARAQSGGAQEVAVPRSQGAEGRSRAPTLPAGPTSASSPAMARRERSSGVPTREPAPKQRGGRARDLELHPSPGSAPTSPGSAPGAELSVGWAGLYSGAQALGSTQQFRLPQKQPIPEWAGHLETRALSCSRPLRPGSLAKSRLLKRSGQGWGTCQVQFSGPQASSLWNEFSQSFPGF